MSNAPVDPAEVPVFTGQLSVLDEKVTALSAAGGALANAGSSVHTTFGGMSAYYQAPEAEQLFAVTKPVADITLSFSGDMCTIAGALGTYSQEIRPLVKKLEELKADAASFRSKVSRDEDWIEDGDLIDENLERRNKIAEVWAQFQAAERHAHDKIVALVCGAPLKVNDGSNGEGMYGYDAEALKQAKSLPWGDAVEESVPAWQVWEHAYDFGKGLIVDGVWGTVKGLGTLVGFDGWDAAGQAWTGLGKLATGLVITASPAAVAFWMADDEDLPPWIRDSRTAMKETGKALVAWDQWGSNPSRAAGAVTFNVLTTVFTGGAGGAVAGAGKAGVAAKALSFAGKAGRAIDPMTYVFKGAGAGVSKIGDVMAGLKGMGKIEIPRIDEGAFSLPEGAMELPDGTIRLPKDTPIPAGAVKVSDDTIRLPEGTASLPPGTVKWPFDGPAKYADEAGNLYKEDGSLYQKAGDARPEPSPKLDTDANTPRTEAPVRQEAPVLAGVGARGGDDVVRVGSDISDPVRAADNAPGGAGDNTPGAAANHLPGGGVGDNLPGGRAGDNMPTNNLDNNPRGGVGDHTPSNSLDNTPPGGARSGDNTSATGNSPTGSNFGDNTVPGPHTDTPGTGGGDLPTGAADEASGGTDDASTPTGRDGEPELTPERRKELQDRHVWLANNDEAWRQEHYNALNRRNRVDKLVDGVMLPQLTRDANGKLIPVHDLPSGPREVRINPNPLKLDSVPDGNLTELNKAMGDRRASVNLNNAELKLKEADTPAHREALKQARAAFDARLPGVPNNSKLSEALGNKAALLHAIPHEFPKAEVIDLPKTPNGANMFDGAYVLPDDWRLLVEEKAPSNGPDWRQGKADPDPLNPSDHGGAQGMRTQQGTRPYIRTILAEMTSRGGRDAEIAKDLRAALKAGKLRYVLVKAKEDLNGDGLYAGLVIEDFKF